MLVKCQWCGTKSERNEMAKIKKGYIHPGCLPQYEAEQQIKRKEQESFNNLVETIKKIHELVLIPKSFYPFIQDLRNGTIRFRGPVQKRYKQGVPYEVIEEAYILAADGIRWAKTNKNFTSTIGELKYGLAIVQDKINQAYSMAQRKKQMENTPKQDIVEIREIKYKKRKNEKDITQFLEDKL